MSRYDQAWAAADEGAADRQQLDQLVACGAKLDRQRPVQHFLQCLHRSDVGTATLQLREAGYEASWMENPTAEGFMVVAERTEVLDAVSIELARSLLELIASRMTEARYEGWKAELRDDEEVRFDPSSIDSSLLEPPSPGSTSPSRDSSATSGSS